MRKRKLNQNKEGTGSDKLGRGGGGNTSSWTRLNQNKKGTGTDKLGRGGGGRGHLKLDKIKSEQERHW